MTQDEIIRMAIEVGLLPTPQLERFAALVAEAKKAEYEKKFDEVFGELIEKIKGGMSAESAIRSLK